MFWSEELLDFINISRNYSILYKNQLVFIYLSVILRNYVIFLLYLVIT